jgi:hypothetical protein
MSTSERPSGLGRGKPVYEEGTSGLSLASSSSSSSLGSAALQRIMSRATQTYHSRVRAVDAEERKEPAVGAQLVSEYSNPLVDLKHFPPLYHRVWRHLYYNRRQVETNPELPNNARHVFTDNMRTPRLQGYLEIMPDCSVVCTPGFSDIIMKWMCTYGRIQCDPSTVVFPRPFKPLFNRGDDLIDSLTRTVGDRVKALKNYVPLLDADHAYKANGGQVPEVGRVTYVFFDTHVAQSPRLVLVCEHGFSIKIDHLYNDFTGTLYRYNHDTRQEEVYAKDNVVVDVIDIRLRLRRMLPQPPEPLVLPARVDEAQRDRTRQILLETDWFCIHKLRVGVWYPRDAKDHTGFFFMYSEDGYTSMLEDLPPFLEDTELNISTKGKAIYALVRRAQATIRALLNGPLKRPQKHTYTYGINAIEVALGQNDDNASGSCLLFDMFAKPQKQGRVRKRSLRLVTAVEFNIDPLGSMYKFEYVQNMTKLIPEHPDWPRDVAKVSPACLTVATCMAQAYHHHKLRYFSLYNAGGLAGRGAYINAAAAVGYASYIEWSSERYFSLNPVPDGAHNFYDMIFCVHPDETQRPNPELTRRYALRDTSLQQKGTPFIQFYRSMYDKLPAAKRKLAQVVNPADPERNPSKRSPDDYPTLAENKEHLVNLASLRLRSVPNEYKEQRLRKPERMEKMGKHSKYRTDTYFRKLPYNVSRSAVRYEWSDTESDDSNGDVDRAELRKAIDAAAATAAAAATSVPLLPLAASSPRGYHPAKLPVAEDSDDEEIEMQQPPSPQKHKPVVPEMRRSDDPFKGAMDTEVFFDDVM